ncbi:hypothetical protein FGO68_gene10709 [Halteria grandinella]|uniref:Uncharacterized protein n=1 Tax=Halteria grandinella TaxID=5974 RepID=A0A8J8T9B9_HALGN|nr:hypothetical protein FGO68_gene10709 [Halteria grandinella]
MIQQIMFQIVYLDLLQTDKWLPELLFSKKVLSQDEGLNEYFELNGLESTKLLINLGSTLIFLIVFIQIHIAIPILDRLVPISFFKTRDLIEKKKAEIYWSFSIRLFIQQFTPLVLSSLINVTKVNQLLSSYLFSLSMTPLQIQHLQFFQQLYYPRSQ